MDFSNTEQAILAAVLRESLFDGRTVELVCAQFCIQIELLNVRESGNGRKMVCEEILANIKTDSEIEKVSAAFFNKDSDKSFYVRIHSQDAVYETSAAISFLDGPKLSIIPKPPLVRIDRRINSRTALESDAESPVLLKSSGYSTVGMMRVINFGEESLGVELRTSLSAGKLATIELSGRISINQYALHIINATLKRIRFKSTVPAPEPLFVYAAGLVLNSQTDNRPNNIDERAVQRLDTANFNIEVNSCLAPAFDVAIRVSDVSVAGFSGKLTKHQDKRYFWSGCSVQLKNTNLHGSVVFIDSDSIRVSWLLDGKNGERHWQDLVAAIRHPSGDRSITSAEELLSAFIRSGTARHDYLKNLPMLKPNLIKGLGEESKYGEWFFKWIERDSKGKIKGHIAAYRLADNLWCAGDLFSDPDSSQKLSPEFAKTFLLHFVDFLEKKSPQPKVYASWKKKHPYWAQTELHLLNSPSTAFSDVGTNYYYLNPYASLEDCPEVSCSEITARDIELIAEIKSDLRNNGTIEFASAFDFDEDRFGSPQMQTMFNQHGLHFFRKYILIKHLDKRYLAIVSRFPAGVSPYSNPTMGFILSCDPAQNLPTPEAIKSLQINCITMGIYPHSLISVRSNKPSSPDDATGRMVVAKPRMWLHV